MERNNAALSLIGLALRGGRLEVGEDAVQDAARAKKVRLMVLASDASERTGRNGERLSRLGECLLLTLPCTKEELGAALGRGSAAIAALTDTGLAEALARRLAAQDPETYGEAAARLALKAKRAKERQSAKAAARKAAEAARTPRKERKASERRPRNPEKQSGTTGKRSADRTRNPERQSGTAGKRSADRTRNPERQSGTVGKRSAGGPRNPEKRSGTAERTPAERRKSPRPPGGRKSGGKPPVFPVSGPPRPGRPKHAKPGRDKERPASAESAPHALPRGKRSYQRDETRSGPGGNRRKPFEGRRPYGERSGPRPAGHRTRYPDPDGRKHGGPGSAAGPGAKPSRTAPGSGGAKAGKPPDRGGKPYRKPYQKPAPRPWKRRKP